MQNLTGFTLPLLLLLLFTSNLIAQEEQLEIDGAIQIGNSHDPTPDPGTIRWTGSDFEGWNGSEWLSLTPGPATCFDGIQNQDETDIDCGGSICNSCLEIGESYQGGIIFYIDVTGAHGKICASNDQNVSQWGCDGIATGAVSFSDGLFNTNLIDSACTTTGIAADVCANLTLNGYSDWYLPSKDEMLLMYNNIGNGNTLGLGNVGGFANENYWSSTETGPDSAWGRFFSDGSQTLFLKYSNSNVRAVRAF